MRTNAENRRAQVSFSKTAGEKQWEIYSKGKSPRGRSPSGKRSRRPSKDYSGGKCTTPRVIAGILPCVRTTKKESGCSFGEKCSFMHREVDSQPNKRSKTIGGECSVAMLKNSTELGCAFQDMDPPKSNSIRRKGTKSLGLKRSVQFSKGASRNENIRERRGPSQGVIRHTNFSCERCPLAPTHGDRSEEETLKQERCARKDAWKMAQGNLKLKEKRTKPHSSRLRMFGVNLRHPERNQREEIVVDSGASIHMLSRKDLISAELETVRVSRTPATIITANGEVQTNEEATVKVYDLDLFLTVQILPDTPAVLSLGKLCEDHRYSYEWTSDRKPYLIFKRHENTMQHGE